MARGRSGRRGRLLEGVEPALERGERVEQVAEALKGPRTLLASLLGLGYLLAERPRWVALTERRLLLVTPPARGGGPGRLELAWPREEVRVQGFEVSGPWTRIVVAAPGRRPVGLNFPRPWRAEAEAIRRALGG